jgi:hypothetical protein
VFAVGDEAATDDSRSDLLHDSYLCVAFLM